jgi:putative endonuclease
MEHTRVSAPHLLAGRQAEDRALAYLQQRGLLLVNRNYSCRAGEIDLVMHDAELLVFVEVRYRKHTSYGGAAGSITLSKQRRIAKAALHYLSHKDIAASTPCRFDVVLLGSSATDLEWIVDAFESQI